MSCGISLNCLNSSRHVGFSFYGFGSWILYSGFTMKETWKSQCLSKGAQSKFHCQNQRNHSAFSYGAFSKFPCMINRNLSAVSKGAQPLSYYVKETILHFLQGRSHCSTMYDSQKLQCIYLWVRVEVSLCKNQ